MKKTIFALSLITLMLLSSCDDRNGGIAYFNHYTSPEEGLKFIDKMDFDFNSKTFIDLNYIDELKDSKSSYYVYGRSKELDFDPGENFENECNTLFFPICYSFITTSDTTFCVLMNEHNEHPEKRKLAAADNTKYDCFLISMMVSDLESAPKELSTFNYTNQDVKERIINKYCYLFNDCRELEMPFGAIVFPKETSQEIIDKHSNIILNYFRN